MLCHKLLNSFSKSTLIFLSFIPLSQGSDGDFCRQNENHYALRKGGITHVALPTKEVQEKPIPLEEKPLEAFFPPLPPITFSSQAMIKRSPPRNHVKNIHHSISPKDLFKDPQSPSTSNTPSEQLLSQSCPNLPLNNALPLEEEFLSQSDSQISNWKKRATPRELFLKDDDKDDFVLIEDTEGVHSEPGSFPVPNKISQSAINRTSYFNNIVKEDYEPSVSKNEGRSKLPPVSGKDSQLPTNKTTQSSKQTLGELKQPTTSQCL